MAIQGMLDLPENHLVRTQRRQKRERFVSGREDKLGSVEISRSTDFNRAKWFQYSLLVALGELPHGLPWRNHGQPSLLKKCRSTETGALVHPPCSVKPAGWDKQGILVSTHSPNIFI